MAVVKGGRLEPRVASRPAPSVRVGSPRRAATLADLADGPGGGADDLEEAGDESQEDRQDGRRDEAAPQQTTVDLGRLFGRRLPHEHVDDDPEVVERRRR